MLVLVFLFNILFNMVMKPSIEGEAEISYSRLRDELASIISGRSPSRGRQSRGNSENKD